MSFFLHTCDTFLVTIIKKISEIKWETTWYKNITFFKCLQKIAKNNSGVLIIYIKQNNI